ncbi:MAG TPA: biotin transporter BioY [Candidatus Dormibacteraeota bacterium]|jgi:biotin transport system substrate-specific component|nr:biotin transporter BioY [Candidatus Dormibacteraeota bacterium]
MSSSAPEAAGRVTLSDLLVGRVTVPDLVRDLALVAAYATLVGVTAQVVIHLPFTPVPVTGQTFGVLVGAMTIGWRRALAGMLLYLAAGVAGLPWFAGGSGGLGVLAAASFGYLLAFPPAGALVGRLAELRLDRTPWGTVAAMAAGNLVIYAGGLAWLVAVLHLGPGRAVVLGVLPFLPGDAIKILLAAGLLPGAWALSRR